MTYAAGELAALTLIRTLTSYTFDATNSLSTANDTTNAGASLINNGKAYYYVFLEPGEAGDRQRVGIGQTTMITPWQTIVRVICFTNPKTKESPHKVLSGIVNALIAKLDTYMELDTVTGAFASVTTIGPVERFTTNEGNTPFVVQELILTWEEVATITQND